MNSEDPLGPDPRLKREPLGLEGPPARVKRESRYLRRDPEDLANPMLKYEHGAGERLEVNLEPRSMFDDAEKLPPWRIKNFAPAVTSDTNDAVWVEKQCPGCKSMVLETDDFKVTQRNTWHVACYEGRGDRGTSLGCKQTVGAGEDTQATASRS